MFIRFSKGKFNPNGEKLYVKCVLIGDSLIMEYGDNIVGVARLHEEGNNFFDYDVIVAKNCELGAAKIARSIKDMICKSNKFSENPSSKRRKYYVEEIEGDALPIEAKLTFSRKN